MTLEARVQALRDRAIEIASATGGDAVEIFHKLVFASRAPKRKRAKRPPATTTAPAAPAAPRNPSLERSTLDARHALDLGAAHLHLLSPNQRAVLERSAAGMRQADIARELGLHVCAAGHSPSVSRLFMRARQRLEGARVRERRRA